MDVIMDVHPRSRMGTSYSRDVFCDDIGNGNEGLTNHFSVELIGFTGNWATCSEVYFFSTRARYEGSHNFQAASMARGS